MATPTKQPVRNHVFHEITRSLCPECRQVVDAQVLIRDGAVYLRKRCPEHGWHEALVSSDAGWHLKSLKYNKPGAIPYDFDDRRTGLPLRLWPVSRTPATHLRRLGGDHHPLQPELSHLFR